MTIIHNDAKKRFDLYDDDSVHVGEIEYMPAGNNEIYATHTEVFLGYEGQGYGEKLLEALVAHAIERGSKIVPLCSFVKRSFQENPEKYAEVIKS